MKNGVKAYVLFEFSNLPVKSQDPIDLVLISESPAWSSFQLSLVIVSLAQSYPMWSSPHPLTAPSGAVEAQSSHPNSRQLWKLIVAHEGRWGFS